MSEGSRIGKRKEEETKQGWNDMQSSSHCGQGAPEREHRGAPGCELYLGAGCPLGFGESRFPHQSLGWGPQGAGGLMCWADEGECKSPALRLCVLSGKTAPEAQEVSGEALQRKEPPQNSIRTFGDLRGAPLVSAVKTLFWPCFLKWLLPWLVVLSVCPLDHYETSFFHKQKQMWSFQQRGRTHSSATGGCFLSTENAHSGSPHQKINWRLPMATCHHHFLIESSGYRKKQNFTKERALDRLSLSRPFGLDFTWIFHLTNLLLKMPSSSNFNF